MNYFIYILGILAFIWLIKILIKTTVSVRLKLHYLQRANELNFDDSREQLLKSYKEARNNGLPLEAFGIVFIGIFIKIVGFYKSSEQIHWDFYEWHYNVDGPESMNTKISALFDDFANDPKVSKMVIATMIETQYEMGEIIMNKIAELLKEDLASKHPEENIFFGVWDRNTSKAIQREVLMSISNNKLIEDYLSSYGEE